MTRAELIKALEGLEGPSREMDAEIALCVGYRSRGSKTRVGINNEVWAAPGEHFSYGTQPPHYTSSIDSALTLGRTEDERREILGAIYDNANETYTIARCILFGCAHALRLREESPQ